MKKHLALAAVLAVGLATPAAAQDADACLKQAFDLAATVQGKNLSEAQLAKIDELLANMESKCDAKDFAAADKAAADVKAAIEGN